MTMNRVDTNEAPNAQNRSPQSSARRRLPVSRGDLVFFVSVAAAAAVLLYLFPERAPAVAESSRGFLLEMFSILPAVVILMGLFAVFVSQELIVRHLGAGSGVRGFFLAVALGSLPTGPLYVAFPLVKAMRAKGAGTANMIAFLTAWASIKLPQEIIELRFLGPAFTATRFLLTLAAAALMGTIAERILRRWETTPATEEAT